MRYFEIPDAGVVTYKIYFKPMDKAYDQCFEAEKALQVTNIQV